MRLVIAAATTFAFIVSNVFTVTPAQAKHKQHKSDTAQYMRAVPTGQPAQR
jgi:hypothetical protein